MSFFRKVKDFRNQVVSDIKKDISQYATERLADKAIRKLKGYVGLKYIIRKFLKQKKMSRTSIKTKKR